VLLIRIIRVIIIIWSFLSFTTLLLHFTNTQAALSHLTLTKTRLARSHLHYYLRTSRAHSNLQLKLHMTQHSDSGGAGAGVGRWRGQDHGGAVRGRGEPGRASQAGRSGGLTWRAACSFTASLMNLATSCTLSGFLRLSGLLGLLQLMGLVHY
jgi:hypothetical protein